MNLLPEPPPLLMEKMLQPELPLTTLDVKLLMPKLKLIQLKLELMKLKSTETYKPSKLKEINKELISKLSLMMNQIPLLLLFKELSPLLILSVLEKLVSYKLPNIWDNLSKPQLKLGTELEWLPHQLYYLNQDKILMLMPSLKLEDYSKDQNKIQLMLKPKPLKPNKTEFKFIKKLLLNIMLSQKT